MCVRELSPSTELGENLMKNILCVRKDLILALVLSLAFSMVVVSAGTASSISVISQSRINGTAEGEEFTVNVNILDAISIYGWMAGLTFNATVLNCTGFFDGEFLKDASGAPQGNVLWIQGTIDNTAGVITAYGSNLLGDYVASGSGQLAYLTFRVKAPGLSDLHLRDVTIVDFNLETVPSHVVDVYTVVVDTTPHTVVTVSNSTGSEKEYGSGFYDHAFNASGEEISFKVTGPYPGFSNVTIPKTLLSVDTDLDAWRVVIDGSPLTVQKRTVTPGATHHSVYFTYAAGVHSIQITTRGILGSAISIAINSTSVVVGSSVTISGGIVADGTVRANVPVTITHRPSSGTWTTLATVATNQNGNYSYVWETKKDGTYEVKASWSGDQNTEGSESLVRTLAVKEEAGGIDIYTVAAIVVGVVIVAAIVVYFVKIRKPEEE